MMLGDLFLIPAFIMIIGALLLPILPQVIRSAFFLVVTFTVLIVVLLLPDGLTITASIMNYELQLLKVDQLSRVFVTIFAMAAFAGGVYAYHIKETGEQVAALLYAGSAMGVTFAGDYFTLFIFWEIMAVASTYLVWARRTDESEKAGMRYLLVHLFGGGLLLIGILMKIGETDSIYITTLIPDGNISSWFILAGVALNAAVPPLHAWLPDAYPKATITGAVFLSAFTTKTAVYVLLRIFPGWEILIALGVIMTLYGVTFAILANDIRSILAYHIVSQVGFMVTGVGIGTQLSLNGTTAHAFSHILYKALLFMGAGAVLQATGKSKLTELGGLFNKLPKVFWLYMVGAFSISGVPLFNGFISKSMVISASGYEQLYLVMFLLMLASVGTFLSVGLKLPYFTWYSEEREVKVEKIPFNMIIGMGILSFLCIMYGIIPSILYVTLPYDYVYEPFTLAHFVESVQMLLFTFVGFWFLREKLVPKPYMTIDMDWFYRKPAAPLRIVFVDWVNTFFNWTEKVSFIAVYKIAEISKNPLRYFVKLKDDDGSYSPDKYRAKTESILFYILFTFVITAIAAIIFLD